MHWRTGNARERRNGFRLRRRPEAERLPNPRRFPAHPHSMRRATAYAPHPLPAILAGGLLAILRRTGRRARAPGLRHLAKDVAPAGELESSPRPSLETPPAFVDGASLARPRRAMVSLVVVVVAAAASASARSSSSPDARRPRGAKTPRVKVHVRSAPGGVVLFDASATLPGPRSRAADAAAWSAVRRASLGRLRPRADLRDVLASRVLRESPADAGHPSALVEQRARWRCGWFGGVSRMTVRARVDDDAKLASFALVASEFDDAPRTDILEQYEGVMGAVGGEVFLRGRAVVARVGGDGGRAIAARAVCGAMRAQVGRTLEDVAAVAAADVGDAKGT